MTLREAKKLLEEKSLEYLLRRDDNTSLEKLKECGAPETEEFLDNKPRLDSKPWVENGGPLFITQRKWIKKYNRAKKVMVSVADYYHAAKLGDEAIASVQKDMGKTRVITSTRIFYNGNNLKAKIVHYHGSTVTKPVERKVIIPNYIDGKLIKGVLDTKKGFKFMQAVFLTDDSKEEILETLGKLSNRKEDCVKIWTPSQSERERYSEGAAALDCHYGGFCATVNLGHGRSSGRSRAVALGAAEFSVRPSTRGKLRGYWPIT